MDSMVWNVEQRTKSSPVSKGLVASTGKDHQTAVETTKSSETEKKRTKRKGGKQNFFKYIFNFNITVEKNRAWGLRKNLGFATTSSFLPFSSCPSATHEHEQCRT